MIEVDCVGHVMVWLVGVGQVTMWVVGVVAWRWVVARLSVASWVRNEQGHELMAWIPMRWVTDSRQR